MLIPVLGAALAAGPAEFITVQSATLSDGLQVVAVQQPDARQVTLVMAIDGGRGDEPAAGLARSTAQTWFSGAATPVATVAEVYERLGATTDVDVTPDATVFTTRVPVASYGDALALEWRRFTGPLQDVDELAAVTREAAAEEYRAKYLDTLYATLYPEGHRYGGLYADPVAEHPVYLASSWVSASWRPDRATLVVVGPESPDTVLCGIEASACPVAQPAVVEAPLELPEPTLRVPPSEGSSRTVGPLAAGVDPTVLLGWALPGTDAIGEPLAVVTREHIVEALQAEVSEARCLPLELGREATTLVCLLPAEVDRDALDRAFRKGWPTKRLGKSLERWRERAMSELLGSTTTADFAQRMALHVRAGGDPVPYTGQLAALAFDEDALVDLLTGAVAWDRALWVTLGP
jgi:hypothetical protein